MDPRRRFRGNDTIRSGASGRGSPQVVPSEGEYRLRYLIQRVAGERLTGSGRSLSLLVSTGRFARRVAWHENLLSYLELLGHARAREFLTMEQFLFRRFATTVRLYRRTDSCQDKN